MADLITVDGGTSTPTAVAEVIVISPIAIVGMGHYVVLERIIICGCEVHATTVIGFDGITRNDESSFSVMIGGVLILRCRRKSAQVVLDVFPNGARWPLANLLSSEPAPLLASECADRGTLFNPIGCVTPFAVPCFIP